MLNIEGATGPTGPASPQTALFFTNISGSISVYNPPAVPLNTEVTVVTVPGVTVPGVTVCSG